jgi:hypothetical protein
MLAQLVNWHDTIRVIPNSGIQFIDYGFNLDEVGRLSREFLERRMDGTPAGPDGKVPVRLFPLWNEDNPDAEPATKPQGDDDVYEINKVRALEPFLNTWVPVPYLRIKPGRGPLGEEILDKGPTNWARVRVVEMPDQQGSRQLTHRVVFAFDTELVSRVPNRPYTAPSMDDAKDEQDFGFAFRVKEVAWFLADPQADAASGQNVDYQKWMDDWLRSLFVDFKKAQRPGRPLREEDLPHQLEHWARYITFLETLYLAISPAKMKLVDTVSAEPANKPVLVDFVLDVGNSRTCGILIESYPNERSIDLNNSLVLQLRDLSRPEFTYNEPFESQVELSQANFGHDHLSRRSTRPRAFFWPSVVRVGPEASRFRVEAEGTEAATGMSSPKRYLWDLSPVNQEWRFQSRDYGADGSGPTIDRAIRRFVSRRGDVIRQIDADERRNRKRVRDEDKAPADRLVFSRSSLFGFMIAEIIAQAMVMINDAAVRSRRRQSDSPRRLNRVIITLPPATPLQEQRVLRSRAEGAVKLIWDLMGWTNDRPSGMVEPRIHVEWDEASCIHFVYLYGEITQKFGGAATRFFELTGRPRPFAEPEQQPAPGTAPEPSLRIASIDVGGGTTDLMITTYYVEENRAIKPVQNFREGFRLAGDDILKAVIERLVLPPIEAELVKRGMRGARELIRDRFGGDRADMPEQEKHLRRQFVLRVLQPLALRMLQAAEQAPALAEDSKEIWSFADFFADGVGDKATAGLIPERIADYLRRPAAEGGVPDFDLRQVSFPIDFGVIGDCVRAVLDAVIENLAEAVHAFDCDVVLLSGRPSRLPAFVDLVVEKLAVPPDRIIPLHEYRAGIWYPFRGRDNSRIEDPKTAAAVGGMLCALAERQIPNFTLYTNRLMMRSTARHIGELELNGQLLNSRLLFSDVDLDNSASQAGEEATIKYFAPMRIGYRQLPYERWTASPLYRLEMHNPPSMRQIRLPVAVTIERASADVDEEADDQEKRKAEALKEDFQIREAEDASGVPLKKDQFELSLDTLNVDEGYWLDTGILTVP